VFPHHTIVVGINRNFKGDTKMLFKNYTPHAIVLNTGEGFPSVGVARVASSHTQFDSNGVCEQIFGAVEGLPDPQEGELIIVSAMVLSAGKAAGRDDLVAPATGHPDVVRNDKGHIVSVPGFVR
jgi:hypothetical protein